MTANDALALGVLTIVPLVLAFVAWRRQWFRLVLLAGGALALFYWVAVALVDPSYDLTRAGQLLIPAFYALLGWMIWCGCAFAGRALRNLTRALRSSAEAQ